MIQVVNEHGFDLGGEFRQILLQSHARKVWGVLGRTKGKPEERARLIAEAEDKFLRQDVVLPEVVRVVDEAVEALYRQVEEHGPGEAKTGSNRR